MSNLTIAVDEQLIRRARVRAIEEGTSVSAKVREFLLRYVEGGGDDPARQRHQAAERLRAMLDEVRAQPGDAPVGRAQRRTLREELYAGNFRERDRWTVREPDPAPYAPTPPAMKAAVPAKKRRRS
jgi:plasmid stability protein